MHLAVTRDDQHIVGEPVDVLAESVADATTRLKRRSFGYFDHLGDIVSLERGEGRFGLHDITWITTHAGNSSLKYKHVLSDVDRFIETEALILNASQRDQLFFEPVILPYLKSLRRISDLFGFCLPLFLDS